jgi:channel protein (hemolysin III family)
MHVYAVPGIFEPVSALTHLAGAAIFAVLGLALMRRARGDRAQVALLGAFAASSVFLLSVSAALHMLPEGSGGRHVLSRLDGAAIFTLIAATHTAMHGLFFRGFSRWAAIALMWASTASAIAVFAVFTGSLPGIVVTIVYLSLGWIASASGLLIWRRCGAPCIVLPLLGGVTYTVGALLLAMRWPTLVPGVIGPHEVWHLAVLAGLLMHWSFLYRNARPAAQEPKALDASSRGLRSALAA